MPDTDPCELCGTQAEAIPSGGYDGIHQRCPQCGEFRLTGNGVTTISNIPRPDKAKLSGWVRDQNMLGEVPELTSDRIGLVAAGPLPGVVERADRLLSYAIRKQKKLSDTFTIIDPALIAVTYSSGEDELQYLVEYLRDEALIKQHMGIGGIMEITPAGHMRYEELQARQPASAQGFVAMWFDKTMRDAYANGFEPAVRDAGYDPLRIDRVEHVGKIDDEIIAQIRRSRFVVADFTGHRGGVYFEAGFALGLDLPVFWTCRNDHIGELHFDIRQFNCIDWADPAELADRLRKRIEAMIGAGPRKPLPA